MKVECARCGKVIEKSEAVADGTFLLCKECDQEATIERLPDVRATMTFHVTKRICASTNGMQFLTSGYPNRRKDRRYFSSMDGLFIENLLPDLKRNEADYMIDGKPDPCQGIEVDVYFSRVKQEGWHEVFVFGYRGKSRLVTPFEPQDMHPGKECTHATVKHGSMYVSTWCDRDYFEYMPEGAVFPVYMKVERKAKA